MQVSDIYNTLKQQIAKCVSDQLSTVPIKDRTNLVWANLSPDHLITGPTKFGRFCVFNQLKLVRGSKFHCINIKDSTSLAGTDCYCVITLLPNGYTKFCNVI